MATFGERLRAFFNPEGEVDRAPRGSSSDKRPLPASGRRARNILEPAKQGSGDVFGVGMLSLDRDVTWRELGLDSESFEKATSSEILEYMADLSPEISSALWNFVRFCNPGWEIVTTRPESEELDENAQLVVNEFLSLLRERYGAPDVIFNSLFLSGFLRGAFLAELVLDSAGREPLDLFVGDPADVEFRKMEDADLGTVWELGQTVDDEWHTLALPTVKYVPIDPLPKDPHGRSPATAALFSSLFLLTILHDMRRVVQQQGYPRMDIEIDLQRMYETMPDDIRDDFSEFEKWVQTTVAEVTAVYDTLQPDDAFVHTSTVKLNRPVGTVDANSLGAIEGLIRSLERMITRALKTMPLLMGSNEAVSETHANRQWEIHAAGIKALQHLAEQMLESLFAAMLEAQGILAVVTVRFAELRASEELRDEQVDKMRIENALAKFMAGWITQEEAALKVVGHEPALPFPIAIDVAAGSEPVNMPEDGEENVERVLRQLVEERRQLYLALDRATAGE